MNWESVETNGEYSLQISREYFARLFIEPEGERRMYDFQVFNGALVCSATWTQEEILDILNEKEAAKYAKKISKVGGAPEIVRKGLELLIANFSKLKN